MLTPEQTTTDALQHALALAYMEQAGMVERLAHETALEVLAKRGVAVGGGHNKMIMTTSSLTRALDTLKDGIRSTSGRTAERWGKPTRAWLDGE